MQNVLYLRIILVLIAALQTSFTLAACNTNSAFITPTNIQLQGAINAANTGGMLSSVWHEVALPLTCTNMAHVEASPGWGNVAISFNVLNNSGRNITFEGESYSLHTTGVADVFMIIAFSNASGNFYPVQGQYNKFQLPAADAKGTLRYTLKARVRYISTASSMTPGSRLMPQRQLFNGGEIRILDFYCTEIFACTSGFGSIQVNAFSFNVNSITCTLIAPKQIKLTSANIWLFPEQGSSQEVASFQLGASCKTAYLGYQIRYDMVDVNNPSNSTSNLQLSKSASQAQGVALQILDSGTPIKFSSQPNSSIRSGSIGRMTTAGGTLSKPMTVRYIRTGKMTPGRVNAAVTVSLSYE